MTMTRQNENVSTANRDKRKGRNGSESKLSKTGQTLKKVKRNGKRTHGRHMVTQIKNIRKRARGIPSKLLSRTPKRKIAEREFVEKKTNNDTRELVLPSDSNVVKGNV
jgi:hypothetical protein